MGKTWCIGIDEVGRGSWAGPVMACACAFPVGYTVGDLHDSKRLSKKQRERLRATLDRLVWDGIIHYAIGSRDATTIDRLGIREANRESMADALAVCIASLPHGDTIASIRIDGRDNYRFEGIEMVPEYVVRGDGSIPEIQAAAIIAKVERDHLMASYDAIYPWYAFGQHKGYGTILHRTALANYGTSPIHRRSFAPMKCLLE